MALDSRWDYNTEAVAEKAAELAQVLHQTLADQTPWVRTPEGLVSVHTVVQGCVLFLAIVLDRCGEMLGDSSAIHEELLQTVLVNLPAVREAMQAGREDA